MSNPISIAVFRAILLAVVLALTACGTKGSLYLPKTEADKAKASPTPPALPAPSTVPPPSAAPLTPPAVDTNQNPLSK